MRLEQKPQTGFGVADHEPCSGGAMSDVTAIEWTDHTFNPWWGCSRVSPACRFCYADRDAQRYGHQVWRRHGPRRMLSEANWQRPLRWNRDAERAGIPAKVFCASMADVFEDHPDVAAPRERLWGLIEATPWLVWQLLTKRPENIAAMVPWGGEWPPHVWVGTSVENQRYADERIPVLVSAAARARIRFLSCEPLLGPVDLSPWLFPGPGGGNCSSPRERSMLHEPRCGPMPPLIEWVICGGESGPRARPTHPAWARSLRDQCGHADVPFFFKQWGEWAPQNGAAGPLGDARQNPHRHRWVSPDDGRATPFGELTGTDDLAWAHMKRAGKKAAGRELDGQIRDEFPRHLAAAGHGATGCTI